MTKKMLALCVLAAMAVAGCGSQEPVPAGEEAATGGPAAAAGKTLTIGVMPKLKGIDYFNATQRGAEEAAKELGVQLVYDGPVTNDTTAQSQMIDTWIARKFDVIAVAPNDPAAIAPVLAKARKRGIKTIAWDADADKAARDVFINQATVDGIAKTMIDLMAQEAGETAKYVIITGSLTAANQNDWMAAMEKYRQERYPNMVNLSPTPKASEEDAALATQVATDVIKTYPDLQGIFAITSVALPGAAEAVRRAGVADKVFLTGLSTPKRMREYVEDGTVRKFALWNAVDLGYLTVYVAEGLATGKIKPGDTTVKAGRLGEVQLTDDEVLLGPPLVFDKDNIAQFDF